MSRNPVIYLLCSGSIVRQRIKSTGRERLDFELVVNTEIKTRMECVQQNGLYSLRVQEDGITYTAIDKHQNIPFQRKMVMFVLRKSACANAERDA